MPRIVQALTALFLLLFCAACSSTLNPEPPPPLSVGHMDIVQKQEYIARTKATLKSFRSAARDLGSRGHASPLRELGDNFERYVEMQVNPIVSDAEARSNLATRMEIAKLQLLCGLTYLELGEDRRIERLLLEMEESFGDPVFLKTPLEGGDLGVTTLEKGVEMLREKIVPKTSRVTAGAPSDAPAQRKDAQ